MPRLPFRVVGKLFDEVSSGMLGKTTNWWKNIACHDNVTVSLGETNGDPVSLPSTILLYDSAELDPVTETRFLSIYFTPA